MTFFCYNICFHFWGIEELFPSETEETYFIPYCKEGNIISPNRGKLYGKFCNIKKEISKISNVKKRHLSESDQEINLNHEGNINLLLFIFLFLIFL